MVVHELEVGNPKGIHLNPATKIAQFAMQNKELEIQLSRVDVPNKKVNAASVMSILTLELNHGTKVYLEMKKSSEDALRVISELLQYDESESIV